MTAQPSNLKNFTRGGQITLHNIRMFVQIMNKVALVAAVVFVLITISISYIYTSQYERYVLREYLWSSVMPIFSPATTVHFTKPNGAQVKVKYADIHASIVVKGIIQNLCLKLIRIIFVGLFASILTFFGISRWLKKRGLSQTEDVHLNGDTIAACNETTALLAQQQINSDLILGGLPLIRGKETSHILFHGTVGSGKSTAIKELLEQIRKRGERAIIYDKGCNFLEEFYTPDCDILLNPMDTRCESWHLWDECRDLADYDSLAAAQIPMPLSSQDPFWVNAARTIFAAAAYAMRNDPERSVVKLLRYLLTADLDILQDYLKGTVAETLVSDKIEKTAISIKSVLATYLKSMQYIKEDMGAANSFSIRHWIQSEQANNWLFITSLGDRHETLKPLITMWLDIAVNALLSLPPNTERRIWLILDELTSLHQVPYLTQTLSESRKFGGCAVIGLQNYAQLAKLYGQEGAREISSLINTRTMFRQPDPSIAKWSAENLGEVITDEVREGISYGASIIRDGISINHTETRKPVVSFSEIIALNDLQAYIRLPGKYPITKIEFTYKHREKRNTGFILRQFSEDKMRDIEDIDQLVERCGRSKMLDNPQIINNAKILDQDKPQRKKQKQKNTATVEYTRESRIRN